MTEMQKEMLRGGLLMQLHAAYPNAMHTFEILTNVKLISQFKQLDETGLVAHLRYLERKSLIERDGQSSVVVRYLITETGRAWLDERDLI